LGSYGSMIKTGSRWLPIKEDEKIGIYEDGCGRVCKQSTNDICTWTAKWIPKQAKGRQAPSCRVGEFGEFRGVGREKCGKFKSYILDKLGL
jgi:hypothetical protein